MADYGETDFFMDLSLVDDPYPYFEYLRSRGSVVPLPNRNSVAVVGFEQALSVHLDTEHFSAVNSVTGPLPLYPFVPEGEDITEQIEAHRSRMPFGEELLTQDPPRHTQLRSLLMRLFTPSRLRQMEATLTALADRLLDEIEPRGGCEAARDYASPYATLAIADLLGVPDADRAEFRKMLGMPPSQIGSDNASGLINPLDFRRHMFTAYIEDRRREPRGDILSDLGSATYPDGSTPDIQDVVRAASLLFGAGQDTTTILLGNCLRVIAEDKDLQERLRSDSAAIGPFIEEVLRVAGPVKSTFRLARKRVSLGGLDIAPGTTVMIATAAANRDPDRYENPAEFQLGRPGAKEHLSFGRGAHTCPGAALARAETRISLERILARLHDIRIDEAHHGPPDARRFAYLPTYVFRSMKELHLLYTPANGA